MSPFCHCLRCPLTLLQFPHMRMLTSPNVLGLNFSGKGLWFFFFLSLFRSFAYKNMQHYGAVLWKIFFTFKRFHHVITIVIEIILYQILTFPQVVLYYSKYKSFCAIIFILGVIQQTHIEHTFNKHNYVIGTFQVLRIQ